MIDGQDWLTTVRVTDPAAWSRKATARELREEVARLEAKQREALANGERVTARGLSWRAEILRGELAHRMHDTGPQEAA
ncbi:MAG TPA: hypothetical protein PLI70_05525 [Gemmatimonadales bacterium]|nr:hypothetical protein [Gemmatimonadales bacterium]HRZ09133.1 hypothetical protein [Gemmatimonadales bacterium]